MIQCRVWDRAVPKNRSISSLGQSCPRESIDLEFGTELSQRTHKNYKQLVSVGEIGVGCLNKFETRGRNGLAAGEE